MSGINEAKLSNVIDYVFNVLATHRHDDYARWSTNSFTQMKKHSDISVLEQYLDFEFTFANTSNTLLKIFNDYNILKLGNNAINLGKDIKQSFFKY